MFHINPTRNKPIYEQIIDNIKESMLKGILQPGDKLPSIRQLAVMITVNPNTISKAYQELERQKVIETIRGRGTFIRTDYMPKVDDEKMKEIKQNLKKLVIEMHYMGLKKQDLTELLSEIYKELERK